jgi:hypothetical protein
MANAAISATQCRSARALLGWSVAKLVSAASSAGGQSTISRWSGGRPCPLSPVQIRRAFEPFRVVFSARRQRGLGPRTLFEVGGDGVRKYREPDQDPPGAIVVVGGFAHTQSRA